MTLKYTILGFLASQPRSGYEIAKEFAQGFGSCFWTASAQQVYCELTKLKQQGEIIDEVISQAGRIEKRVYSITAKGEKEIINWLMKPTEPAKIREELGVMGIAGHLVDVSVIVSEIERRREFHFKKMRQMEKLDEPFVNKLELLDIKDAYMHIIIRRAISYQKEWVMWCDEAIQVINFSLQNSNIS